MLRVPVVGGDAPLVALSVGENDAIAQRVQGKGPAQLGKEVRRTAASVAAGSWSKKFAPLV